MSRKPVGAGLILMLAVAATVFLPNTAQAGFESGCAQLQCVEIETSYAFDQCSSSGCEGLASFVVQADAPPLIPGYAWGIMDVVCVTNCGPDPTKNVLIDCVFFYPLPPNRCQDSTTFPVSWGAGFPCAVFNVHAEGNSQIAVILLQTPLVPVPGTIAHVEFQEFVLICSDGTVQIFH